MSIRSRIAAFRIARIEKRIARITKIDAECAAKLVKLERVVRQQTAEIAALGAA